MAYNSGFPVNYQYYQPVMQQPVPVMPVQQPMQQPMQQMQAPQMQNQTQPVQQQQSQYPTMQSGFVRVRNENEARTYFVAPGNSVTFINEDSTYLFTKTVEINQLDKPKFEKYRLVKEEDEPAPVPVEAPQKPVERPPVDLSKFAMKDEIAAFKAEIDALKSDIETFRGDLYGLAGKKKTTTKKEVASDE